MKQQLLDEENFDPEEHYEATNYLLDFIWCHNSNVLDSSTFSTSDNPEIACWVQKLYKHHSLSTDVASPITTRVASHSDSTLRYLASTAH